VVGFGGYPAFPALLAARADKIPTLIHEQNAVLGRVNRLVASRVEAIATAYPDVGRLPGNAREKVHLVGNPVREEILALREQPYPALGEDGIFRLLVTGGSQGAAILSEVVPEGLALLPEHFRRRLQVTQQCRAEDIEQVKERYAQIGIPADLATYLPDLPDRLAWSHLVIARAGASTIAELTAAGRPAILIPLPGATDDHQTANAREMARAGGARAIPQGRFSPIELAKQMQKLGLDPGSLANAAARAQAIGRPNAARDLADLVEQTGRNPGVDPLFVRENVLRPMPNGPVLGGVPA
jgi:UDP-N-acetylglucosamine--N-acetylmuramyl-(pentapeptide) pyrophosphoryl-undecaprenol N-acetylglucosamine transferase